LRDFWREFTGAVADIKDLKISDVIDALNEILGPHIFPPQPGGGDPRRCPLCGDGQLSLKLGKFGAFIGCSNYPDCSFTRALAAGAEGGASGPKELGTDPETGKPVTLRTGRFGPYVQRGTDENGVKPKRVKVPRDMPIDSIDLARALLLLSLPRNVGEHPETREPIIANIGRFGPYLHHQGQYANLDSSEEMFSVGLNRAVTLLAEKKSRARPQRESKALRELGAHPEDGKPVRVMDGRYGPYVKHERLNATLPKDLPPDKVTLEEALALLAARAARGAKGKARKAKPANDDAGVKKSARDGAKKKSAKGRKAKVSDDTSESEIAHEEETGAKRTARAGR